MPALYPLMIAADICFAIFEATIFVDKYSSAHTLALFPAILGILFCYLAIDTGLAMRRINAVEKK